MTIIAAPATHAVRRLQHRSSHTSHCKLQLYHITFPYKNKLDASNTLLLNYVAARVTLQTVATYVTIEHIDLDSYLTHRGAYSRIYK